jgi:hypothetical protein
VIYTAVNRRELRAARIGGRRELVIHGQWLDEYLEWRSKVTEV